MLEPEAHPEEAPVTIAEAAKEFLRRFQARVASGERSPRTLEHYRWALREYLLPAWGERGVESILPDDVVALSQSLRDQGRKPPTLRAVEATASRLFSFAVRRGYIQASPFAKLERGERARVRNDDRRVLSNDEARRLLEYADGLVVRTLIATLEVVP